MASGLAYACGLLALLRRTGNLVLLPMESSQGLSCSISRFP